MKVSVGSTDPAEADGIEAGLCSPTGAGTCHVGFQAVRGDREFPRGKTRNTVIGAPPQQFIALYDNACKEIGKIEEGVKVGDVIKAGADIASTLPYKVVIDGLDSESERAKIDFFLCWCACAVGG